MEQYLSKKVIKLMNMKKIMGFLKRNLLWVILVFVIIISSGVGGYLYWKKQQAIASPTIKLINEYENLETSYEDAIKEIENIANYEYGDLSILRENLKSILDDLRQEKELLVRQRKLGIYDSNIVGVSNKKQLESLLQASKKLLIQKVEILERENKMLSTYNQSLRNNKLQDEEISEETFNSLNSQLNDEKEKNRQIVNSILKLQKKIKASKSKPSPRQSKMQDEEQTYQAELKESIKIIKTQIEQLSPAVEKLKKTYVEYYFFYNQSGKKYKIYITENPISKILREYFFEKKPKIYFESKIPQDLVSNSNQVDLIIFNENGSEVINLPLIVRGEKVTSQISAKLFSNGSYYVQLKQAENIILFGGQQRFEFSN